VNRREQEDAWRSDAIRLRTENGLLRELVVSMALGIPREQLPDAERHLLDDIVGAGS
jgi:hypothetical protein